jgi:FkbM family methyltransferase
MKLASYVYNKALTPGRIRRRGYSMFRNLLIKLFNDPPCALPIHGHRLTFPLSHQLPTYLRYHLYYDKLPKRLSEFLHAKDGKLTCIDVGANIGDTIAAFYKNDSDTFLAIEPNPNFFKYLVSNWDQNKNITAVALICSSRNYTGAFDIQEKRGTASIHAVDKGTQLGTRTLDALVLEYPTFANCNMLKIDTDGHDFEVLAGAEELLLCKKPFVLFECQPFGRNNYIEASMKNFGLLKHCGYNHALIYDHIGYLMGRVALSDESAIQNLLFYQLIGGCEYYDILVIQDDDFFSFYNAEKAFYLKTKPD